MDMTNVVLGFLFIIGFVLLPKSASAAEATGPLRVSERNPRYFEDGAGKVVYLTGSHTWSNMKDIDVNDPPTPFDFDGYLDALAAYGHNFIRLWTWELARYTYAKESMLYASPFPWKRTGPGLALDGKPKFDLTQFDDAYFERLRDRVRRAGERGFYVSVMLFEGHGVQRSLPPWRWDGHPFNAANNVNGIDGDPNGDGYGIEVHTLAVPAVTAVQEAYVRRTVEALNDLDNVLYEIANEAGPYSTEWQYHMIRFVQELESTMPKAHPVGMTFQYEGGSNATLFESPADWISPGPEGGYRDDPPPADGRKVIVTDTDHLWGIGGNADWVWKSLTRGMNPIYMDPFDTQGFRSDETIRLAMGRARAVADDLPLAEMTPRGDLASTGFCLASSGSDRGILVVFIPSGGSVSVDLREWSGPFSVEWIPTVEGESVAAPSVDGGASRTFEPPFEGSAVLVLRTATEE